MLNHYYNAKLIESLHALKFNKAIFIILLDEDEERVRKKIENVIQKKIKANNIAINWMPPPNKSQWLKIIGIHKW